MMPDSRIPGGELERWLATLQLSDAALARQALAGDPVARFVVRMPTWDRWFEACGDAEADMPVTALAADARRQRRRRVLRGQR